jgi:protein-L-isoaspartate(D-aspartate) O-methyltransferase
LHQAARRRLEALRSDLNWSHLPRLVHGDGCAGHIGSAPFDTIIAAAGGEEVPEAWRQQLAPSGRLVAPTTVADGSQALVVIDHHVKEGKSHWKRAQHEGVLFVSLKSGVI